MQNFGKLTQAHNFTLTLNNIFSYIVTNLKIPKLKSCNNLSEKIPQSTLSDLLKYTNYRSINTIRKYNTIDH